MSDKRVVLVTGVADYWGGRVAARLAAEPGYHVIGIDDRPPAEAAVPLDFVQADIRNPVLAELLQEEEVEAVCHLKFRPSSQRNEKAFDLNVMGTTRLLGACAQAGVGKVVLRSSTAVYGAHPDNSAFLTEEMPLRGSRRNGTIRDLMEIEAFCNGFRGQSPQTALTVLRFANIVGPTADTPMTRFLKRPTPAILLGFDPIMQLVHEDDVIDALVHAVLKDVPGVFNVAAEGAMPLSRILKLTRRVPLPILHPLAYWASDLLPSRVSKPRRQQPFDWDYLRYSWVADLTKMREEMVFLPLYTATEALRQFAGPPPVESQGDGSGDLSYDESQLRDSLERRRRAREREEASD